MSQTLPPNANIEHLRKQARSLQRACRDGDREAQARVRASASRLAEMPDVDFAQFSLSDAQHAIARDYGFDSWPKLKLHFDEPAEAHASLLRRVANLIGERTEEASKVFRRFLHEDEERAAAVAIGLGQETGSRLMTHMAENELQVLAEAISRLEVVTTEVEDEALEMFEQMLAAKQYVSRGGIDYAEGALTKAVGDRKARAILRRIRAQRDAVAGWLVKLAESDPAAFERALSTLQPDDRFLAIVDLESELPDSIAVDASGSNEDAVTDPSNERVLDALEALEQLVVTYRHLYRGGTDYVRGVLEKSMGPEKARSLLGLAKNGSGLLKMNGVEASFASAVLEGLRPGELSVILTRLETRKGLALLGMLRQETRDAVIPLLSGGRDHHEAARLDRVLLEALA